MLRCMRTIARVVVVVLLAAASPSLAWSTKEHIQLTRIAAERLIADEKTSMSGIVAQNGMPSVPCGIMPMRVCSR